MFNWKIVFRWRVRRKQRTGIWVIQILKQGKNIESGNKYMNYNRSRRSLFIQHYPQHKGKIYKSVNK